MSGRKPSRPGIREAQPAWPQAAIPYLLDVNVLIALIDPMHPQHEAAHRFMQGVERWATCPLTENGVVRIVGHPRYPHVPGPPRVVAEMLMLMREQRAGHVFWPDDVSLLDKTQVDAARLLDANQITDVYLLALAVAHGGQLATFDRRLATGAVVGGQGALHLIDATP